MKYSSSHKLTTVIVTALFLAAGVVADASAQRNRDRGGDSRKPQVLFPDATREAPKTKASSKLASRLQKVVEAYEKDDNENTRALADEILANESANEYDRAFASQLAAQAAYNSDDNAAAKRYLQQAIDLNALDNNGHYQSMFMLAQLHMQDDEYDQALALVDRYLGETKSQKPEEQVVKGNILYRLERYPEAIAVLKPAIDATPEPRSDWVQILMASYLESDQVAEAATLAEQIAARAPDDKRAQMNLAAVYMQAERMDKATETLERLRAAGQLTEDRDYRQLYSLYLNSENKEQEAIAVINEGLEKGILKPDYQPYVALAQAYYFSDQPGPAIEAYRKAAPLAPDGETYLNLARALWSESRIPEAKEAAKAALEKGLKRPDDAKKILALP